MRSTFFASTLLGLSVSALAANGDLDTTFGTQGVARMGIIASHRVAPGSLPTVQPLIQPDGKILSCVAIDSGGVSGTDILVARFTADGVLDPEFSFDGKVTIDFDGGGPNAGGDYCAGLALQTDGKIVVAGSTKVNGTSGFDFAAARLLTDGTLDATFGSGTGKITAGFDLGGTNDDVASGVAIQADGKIVIGGHATATNGTTRFAVLRLSEDGTRDAGFNLTGRQTVTFGLAVAPAVDDDEAGSLALDSSGRILLSGRVNKGANSGSYDFGIIRLLPDGQLDDNFNASGFATVAFDLGGANGSNNDLPSALLLQRDGRIVLAGVADSSNTTTANYDMAITRLLPDGSPDASFGIGSKTLVPFDLQPGGQDVALALNEQTNRKLLMGGQSTLSTGGVQSEASLVRLNSDGTPDAEFGTDGKRAYDFGLYSPPLEAFTGIAFQGTQIIAGLLVEVAPQGTNPVTSGTDSAVVRIQNDLIFADDFD